jgi:hypothetical protein
LTRRDFLHAGSIGALGLSLSQWFALKAGGAVTADKDVFEYACRMEIAMRVDRWLRSPAGQEAVEHERKRALQNQLKEGHQTEQPSWIERQLRKIADTTGLRVRFGGGP